MPEGNETMTFDDILKDKAYQSEFDRRVSKALDTAKTGWDTDAAKREAEIYTALGIKSKDDIPALREKLNSKQEPTKQEEAPPAVTAEQYQQLLDRLAAVETTGNKAQAELTEKKQRDLLIAKEVPEIQMGWHLYEINKLVDDKTDFAAAAELFLKDHPVQKPPPPVMTGSGKPMATATETERIRADYKAAVEKRDRAEMSRIMRLAGSKGVDLT